MRRHVSIAVALAFFAGSINAGQAKSIMREAEFDGCHFKMKDTYGGELRVSRYAPPKLAFYSTQPEFRKRHSVEVVIRFRCQTTKGQEAYTNMGYSYEKNQWRLIPDPNDPQNSANMKLYKLHGPKIEGVASTYDQTTGEPTERIRGLGFCLTDQKQILCGVAQSVGLVAYPKESSLPQVLKLLESIEFIEPSQPTPATP
ncbi:hypothetical protein ACOXVJ_16525 [Pseudomonas knackmussii]|uniref:hypothetical protein n=1 Tax=Pseudomonas knackmussii TaxID=65741 RepID=UPI003BD8BA1C